MIETDRLKCFEDTESELEARYFLRDALQIIKMGAVQHLDAQLVAGPDADAVQRLNWALEYVDDWWHGEANDD